MPCVVALRSDKMLVFLRGAEVQVSVKIEVPRLRAIDTSPKLPVPDAPDFLQHKFSTVGNAIHSLKRPFPEL